MTLGERLIAEIARLGHWGRYFDYAGYCRLRAIDSPDALRTFLDEQGYAGVAASDDPSQLANALARFAPTLCDVPVLTFVVGTALGMIGFAFAMFTLPAEVGSYGEMKALLLNNLGIIVPLLLGFWVGYAQQSLRAMLLGVALGASLGGLGRFLASYRLWVAVLLYPVTLGVLMACALRRGRALWRETTSQVVEGAFLLCSLGFLVVVLVGTGMCLEDLEACNPTVAQYRQALWLLGLAASPLLGVVLIGLHWALALRHPGGGPILTLGASYCQTPGLERVPELPRLVWETVQRRVLKEDPRFRRRQEIYFAATMAFIVSMSHLGIPTYWRARLLSEFPPHLAAVVSDLLGVMGYCSLAVVCYGLTVARFRAINARVAEELQKYPDPVTLDQLAAGSPFADQKAS